VLPRLFFGKRGSVAIALASHLYLRFRSACQVSGTCHRLSSVCLGRPVPRPAFAMSCLELRRAPVLGPVLLSLFLYIATLASVLPQALISLLLAFFPFLLINYVFLLCALTSYQYFVLLTVFVSRTIGYERNSRCPQRASIQPLQAVPVDRSG